MTEEKFEEVVEQMGDSIEKAVEGAADKFDKSINKAWKHLSIRIAAKALIFLTGIGLIVSAILLMEHGHITISKVCIVSGILVIVSGVAEMVIFKTK